MNNRRLGDYYIRESKISAHEEAADLRRQKLEAYEVTIRKKAAKQKFALERIQGTPLSQFFNEDEVAICLEFIKTMRRRFYKRAETILPTRELRNNLPSTGMFGLLSRDGPVIQKWKGYGIGYMCGAEGVLAKREEHGVDRGYHLPAQNVYLCNDGRLRTKEAMSLSPSINIQLGFYSYAGTKEETFPDMSSAGYRTVRRTLYNWVDQELGEVLAGHVTGRH